MPRLEPEPNTPALPGVSYVMPVLNEQDYLEAAVKSIIRQTYPGPVEIILALGPSTDSTSDVVRHLLESDPRIRSIENPQSHIAIGLNLAIRASQYPIVVRVDAHTELPEGYTVQGVSALLRTGAVSVGGIMSATGRSTFQSAVARAYNSPFGLGGGAYHGVQTEGPAESAYLGIMRKEALIAVGLYDESLRRGEDWELNYRLRQAGHVVWLDPTLVVDYWPRDRPAKLARQFLSTGIWRGELVRRLGFGNSLRFFAPPLLLVSLLASVIVATLQITGVLHGPLSVVCSVVYLAPVSYLCLLVWLFCSPSSGRTFADRRAFALVLVIMHMSWAAGFITSVVRGARGATDSSRVA